MPAKYAGAAHYVPKYVLTLRPRTSNADSNQSITTPSRRQNPINRATLHTTSTFQKPASLSQSTTRPAPSPTLDFDESFLEAEQALRSRNKPPPTSEDLVGLTPDHEEHEGKIKEFIHEQLIELAQKRGVDVPPWLRDQPAASDAARLPRAVQSLYLEPLKRTPTHNIPSATLQLRSYSARNVEFMADFALRAAYFLDLPAKGPVPLPRKVERWTVPRSVFVHKKAQENWERITMRRMIQIVDGHPEAVQMWLAFIRKNTWYGVGMKANVWQYEALPEQLSQKEREEKQLKEVERGLESVDWSLFGKREDMAGEKAVVEALEKQGFGKGTVSEALKALSTPGGGAQSIKKMRKGRPVRRSEDKPGDNEKFFKKARDEQRIHRHEPPDV